MKVILGKILNKLELIVEPSFLDNDAKQNFLKETIEMVKELYGSEY